VTQMIEKIALEEHFLLDEPEHVERFLAAVPILPPAAVRAIRPLLHNLGDGRLELMDRTGIRMAVLSSTAIVQGVLDRDTAIRVAREANDALAEAVRAHPDRYAGFASIPLQDPEAGADELERAVTELGMVGGMVFGHTDGHYLDEDRYPVLWERLESPRCSCPDKWRRTERRDCAPRWFAFPALTSVDSYVGRRPASRAATNEVSPLPQSRDTLLAAKGKGSGASAPAPATRRPLRPVELIGHLAGVVAPLCDTHNLDSGGAGPRHCPSTNAVAKAGFGRELAGAQEQLRRPLATSCEQRFRRSSSTSGPSARAGPHRTLSKSPRPPRAGRAARRRWSGRRRLRRASRRTLGTRAERRA
jgi:Amidohydrolase